MPRRGSRPRARCPIPNSSEPNPFLSSVPRFSDGRPHPIRAPGNWEELIEGIAAFLRENPWSTAAQIQDVMAVHSYERIRGALDMLRGQRRIKYLRGCGPQAGNGYAMADAPNPPDLNLDVQTQILDALRVEPLKLHDLALAIQASPPSTFRSVNVLIKAGKVREEKRRYSLEVPAKDFWDWVSGG